jgi:uroporphyrinogen decarboxylase
MIDNKTKKRLLNSVKNAFHEGRRLVVPLVGFPGINLVNSTIKLAQQNYGEHFKVIKANYEKFLPDAIFPLMDLSVEANALGKLALFPKEESATILKDNFSINDLESIKNIKIQFDSRLLSYVETLKLMKNSLPSTVLKGAYVTGPYTLTGLLIGADEAAISTIVNKDKLSELCKFANSIVQTYTSMLVTAGADIICILEPSAVMLSPDQFQEFSGNLVKELVESYKYSQIDFIYHICGNSTHLVEKMCQTGVSALSLDSIETGVDLNIIADKIHEEIILIGNTSPVGVILNGSPPDVEKEVNSFLKSMNKYPNFILSTGCDLPQDTPIENIFAFMKTGREFKIE